MSSNAQIESKTEGRRKLLFYSTSVTVIEHGFSRWIILDRHLGCPIGDSGLVMLHEYGWIDLDYRLAQPYWGKGLATEAAPAWVRTAFDDFHMDRLTAFVHHENTASIRVLQKLGFHAERRDTIMGMNSIPFSLGVKDARAVQQHPAGSGD